MATFRIENELGQSLQLSGMEHKWQIKSITGLNQPNAALSLSVIPTFDGERLNSARLEKRNPVITLAINGNVEKNLLELNRVIQSKKFLRLYFKSNIFDVYVNGTVESFEYDHFEDGKVIAQISLICENPYWISNSENTKEMSKVINLLEFPISLPDEGIAFSEIKSTETDIFFNRGNVNNPVKIEIVINGAVENPKIINTTAGKTMEIKKDFKAGDVIYISTGKGEKAIDLYRDGELVSIINAVELPIEWLELVPGNNLIQITAKSGVLNMQTIIKESTLYGGV